MSTMKKIAQLLALSLAAADGNMDNMFMGEQEYVRRMNERNALKCGLCKNFPKGTYCKLVGHRVSRTTPAYRCENFEFNEQKKYGKMRSIELIELGLNEIARECRIIDGVMTDDIHAGQLLEVTRKADKGAVFDRMATQHSEMLREVHEKVRDLLEFVGEYMNGQDMVSAVDLAINKTIYDLVYERTKEEDYEGKE